jgi:Phage tail lysozyme
MASLFEQKAPSIMRRLMADFGLDLDGAAAIVGNLGHESGGFRFLQEKKPLIPGSKGGYGWAQWTGARRRNYEAYCARNKLDPASDQANYGFLYVELTGSESAAIGAVKRAETLRDKVIQFELKFERAGIKHYEGRLRYAVQALAAFKKGPVVVPPPIEPKPEPPPAKPKPKVPPIIKKSAPVIVVGGGMASAAAPDYAPYIIGAVVVVVVIIVAVVLFKRR